MFSEINTATSRQETCAFRFMLKECGAVVDRWRRYAPKNSLPLSEKYNSIKDCLRKTSQVIFSRTIPNCTTQLSCNEIKYSDLVSRNIFKAPQDTVKLDFYIKTPIVTIMKETPDFTLGDLFGQLGGFVGICCGMSFLSILELIVYFVLFIARKVRKACYSRIQQYLHS